MKRFFRDVQYAKANCALVLLFCACLLKKPCRDHWHRGLDAMEDALQLEKQVFQSLLNLHKIAEDANDPQV